MNYDNVKLWFAKDEDEQIITINEIDSDNKNKSYSCPICGSYLKPKAIKSKRVTPHFAHIDSSKCNSESMIHWWFKYKFIEKGDKFTVVSDKERHYICKNILVEKSYKVSNTYYKPDVTVTTECGETIYFEMAFSNKKKVKDYLDIWLELKNIVVEVDIKHLMNQDAIPSFKALFYNGKCFNTKRNDTYYNTIGKYKEDKLSGKVDNKLKKRVQKLDWFWDDLLRYKNGETDIEQIINAYDGIDRSDFKTLKTILNKLRCTLSWDTLIKEKIKIILTTVEKENITACLYTLNIEEKTYRNSISDIILHFQNSSFPTLNFSISIHDLRILDVADKINEKSGGVNFLKDKIKSLRRFEEYANEEIKLHKADLFYRIYPKITRDGDTSLLFSYIGEYKVNERDFRIEELSESAIKSKIHLKIENLNKKIEKVKTWHNAKTNNILWEAIEKLNDKYKTIDPNYHLTMNRYEEIEFIESSSSSRYIPELNLSYDFRRIDNLFLDANLIISNNLKLVIDCIDKYFNNIESNCLDCDNKMTMSIKERSFFLKNKLHLPKRCKTCRSKRKLNKK